jgi:hypothetical protein
VELRVARFLKTKPLQTYCSVSIYPFLRQVKPASQSKHQTTIKMASHSEHDLLPDQTEGFKVGEKKTLDEYKNMGKHRSFMTLRS